MGFLRSAESKFNWSDWICKFYGFDSSYVLYDLSCSIICFDKIKVYILLCYKIMYLQETYKESNLLVKLYL